MGYNNFHKFSVSENICLKFCYHVFVTVKVNYFVPAMVSGKLGTVVVGNVILVMD